VLVKAGKGLIDPCPLWDRDGKVYLVHAYAGSRAGIKSLLLMHELDSTGTKVLNEGVLVFDGHDAHPTVEGPKLYQRNGYYYISAPAGGVSTGWQLILRSKHIYGPYEEKIVLDQGSTAINGPHQGAWVDTPEGEWWFMHFQDKGAYGRVVHLQPMEWKNNWPVMGIDKKGEGKGEPVLHYSKPKTSKKYPISTPAESDEFNASTLGLQWQWHANPQPFWAFPMAGKGKLRLYSVPLPEHFRNYWDVPNLLLQKFPAEAFEVNLQLHFQPKWEGEKAGLVVMGADYSYVAVVRKGEEFHLMLNTCTNAEKGTAEQEEFIAKLPNGAVYLRLSLTQGARYRFAYSTDGQHYQWINNTFTAREGKWIGAKMGVFISRKSKTNDAGFVDLDYFRITKPSALHE
jgi:beta-xylosidase